MRYRFICPPPLKRFGMETSGFWMFPGRQTDAEAPWLHPLTAFSFPVLLTPPGKLVYSQILNVTANARTPHLPPQVWTESKLLK